MSTVIFTFKLCLKYSHKVSFVFIELTSTRPSFSVLGVCTQRTYYKTTNSVVLYTPIDTRPSITCSCEVSVDTTQPLSVSYIDNGQEDFTYHYFKVNGSTWDRLDSSVKHNSPVPLTFVRIGDVVTSKLCLEIRLETNTGKQTNLEMRFRRFKGLSYKEPCSWGSKVTLRMCTSRRH